MYSLLLKCLKIQIFALLKKLCEREKNIHLNKNKLFKNKFYLNKNEQFHCLINKSLILKTV